MVGRGEFMDVHEAWVRGKTVSEIARLTGRDRKTIRRMLREGAPKPRAPREVSSKLDPTAATCSTASSARIRSATPRS
jgi:predicted transcriptional regulator